MKRTQFIDIITTIKRTKVTFVSIMLFVALSTAIYTGFSWSSKAINADLGRYTNETAYHDFEIYVPFGISEDELKSISEQNSSDTIEANRITYRDVASNNSTYQLKVSQLNSTVDKCLLIQGAIPTRSDEIALEQYTAQRLGYKVGDTITFEAYDGTINLLYSRLLSFNQEIEDITGLSDLKDKKLDDLNCQTFTITALVNSPECMMRNDDWYGAAFTNGRSVNGFAYVTEEAFNKEIYSEYNELLVRGGSLDQFDFSSKKYDTDSSQLKENLSTSISPIKEAKISKVMENYELAKPFIENQLELMGLMIETSEEMLEEEKAQGIVSEDELLEKQKKLEEEKTQYQTFTEQWEKLQANIDLINNIPFIAISAKQNVAVQSVQLLSRIMQKIKYSMAGLFLIVGILVCYFAILRLVNNQLTLIGTQKANGFYKREILLKYISYTGVALLAGCLIGGLLGGFVVEKVVCSSIARSLMMGGTRTLLTPFEWIGISLVEIALLLGVTVLASIVHLRKNAILLLSGNTERRDRIRFYERFRIWKKLPLLKKTIVNNFFTDKRRVFGTLVGVAGCTALIVTSFTLNDDILNSYDRQYSSFYHFDTLVFFDEKDESAPATIEKALSENGLKYAQIYNATIAVTASDNNYVAGYVWVPLNQEDFSKLVTIKSVDSSQKDTTKGVWVSCAIKNYYGNELGEELTASVGAGQSITFVPSGYFVSYLSNFQAIMDEESYTAIYHKSLKGNAFMVDAKDLNNLEEILSKTGVSTRVQNYKSATYGTFSKFASVSKSMVLVYVFLAVLMAFLVLLNLLTMFVEEKKKELIVLMINGYPQKAVRKYISGDTILLTIVGIIIGIVLGSATGILSVMGFDTSITYFMRAIDWKAILIGTGGTAVISFAMCQIALYRIKKFKMSDINT